MFDGYSEGPFNKDTSHLRRSAGVVSVECLMEVSAEGTEETSFS